MLLPRLESTTFYEQKGAKKLRSAGRRTTIAKPRRHQKSFASFFQKRSAFVCST
jgi:hypothetical protein